ncbi:MAG: S53 family peptidase, partial [Mycobacterium sp.]
PYARLLAGSADLGPARDTRVQLTAALRDDSRPARLVGWARRQGLTVRWNPGHSWAIVEGPAEAVAQAFGVDVHDYRGQLGQVFYASGQQPSVPPSLRPEVSGLGRILGYTPHHVAAPWIVPAEVPDQGLTPQGLLRGYNVDSLRAAGFTGKGVTVVVFAFHGFDQADLDTFSTTFGLPKFTPEVVGDQLPGVGIEATMDLEVVHAIAPDARTVIVNAQPTVEGDGGYEKIARMLDDTAARFPGAVWSFSLGWGCDRLATATDMAPVREALADAHRTGTVAFDASGDVAGLNCKGGRDWSAPPGADDVGLDAVASVPEMTDVGGTSFSTDSRGGRLAEQAWFNVPLSIGSGGGVSALFERPPWQQELSVGSGAGRRLTPDVAAVADPLSGMKIVFNGQVVLGGGTSLAAPIWAGLAAVINQFLPEHGGRLLGDLNPLLYRIARGAPLPAFHDITVGGNAVDTAGPGYDLVTGLGTPDVEKLLPDLLAVQKTLE